MGHLALKLKTEKERVWLTGVRRLGQTFRDFEASLEELSRLVDTAGGEVVGTSSQTIDSPNPKTFLGKGKVLEISEQVKQSHVDSVAIDDELTATQNKNLEDVFGVKVLDRSAVILDIFAKRAHTKEGRLQVELAQLQYIQPRLKGMWSHFSKQTGGIGTRGPGETQLEVDRRRVREKITKLKERLDHVETHRTIHREKRKEFDFPIFALVGYTNAGKSTLFNTLTSANAFVEDKLFATLDPLVRRLKLPSNREILLTDTVGFIRKLPHSLVEAFKATFEEVSHADYLIHVVDGSDPEIHKQVETVSSVLREMQLDSKPVLTVLNKKDREGFYSNGYAGIPLSALSGEGFDLLLQEMESALKKNCERATLLIPHTRGDILSLLYRFGHVLSLDPRLEGTLVECDLPRPLLLRFQKYDSKFLLESESQRETPLED